MARSKFHHVLVTTSNSSNGGSSDEAGGIDSELSDGEPTTGLRRWLVVAGVLTVPMVIGVLVSIVLYSTRVLPPGLPPLPSPSGRDAFVLNGQVLLLEPATSDPVFMLAGQQIEVVLQTGIGQKVSTLDPSVLESVANPLCHLATICGVTGAAAWTFLALHPGTAHLHVIFGTGTCPQRASCPLVLQLLVPVTVISPEPTA